MRASVVVTLIALAVMAVACEGGEGNLYGHPIRNGICTSGLQWHAGASGEMDPGMDCIGCHASNEGPGYTIAGTAFLGPHDEDDCYGQSGVTVAILDSAGNLFTKNTNATGNFHFKPAEVAGLKVPFSASVSFNGKTSAMATHQTVGACNTCHTPDGANGAPGRIIAPAPTILVP